MIIGYVEQCIICRVYSYIRSEIPGPCVQYIPLLASWVGKYIIRPGCVGADRWLYYIFPHKWMCTAQGTVTVRSGYRPDMIVRMSASCHDQVSIMSYFIELFSSHCVQYNMCFRFDLSWYLQQDADMAMLAVVCEYNWSRHNALPATGTFDMLTVASQLK